LGGIAFVPVLGAWYVTDEVYAHKYTPNLINTLTEPWPATDELVSYLGDNIGLRNTRQFRGVALMQPESYETTLVLASLWGNLVPSMNVYSILGETPRFFYFTYHMSQPDGAVVRSFRWPYAHLHASSSKILHASSSKILQALGVRYDVHAWPDGEEVRS